MEENKRIEVVELHISDIKTTFGNPRKIAKKKLEELRKSLETYGDFGVFVVNEENELIAGHQRLTVLKEMHYQGTLLCKRLIGYSEAELRAINIKDNTHAGEWDLDLLADWTADLNLDLGLEIEKKTVLERPIDEMELIHYEKYDYVLIACRDELSYNSLIRSLGIEDKKVLIGPKKRPIKGRAIWFEDMNVDFVPKERE